MTHRWIVFFAALASLQCARTRVHQFRCLDCPTESAGGFFPVTHDFQAKWVECRAEFSIKNPDRPGSTVCADDVRRVELRDVTCRPAACALATVDLDDAKYRITFAAPVESIAYTVRPSRPLAKTSSHTLAFTVQDARAARLGCFAPGEAAPLPCENLRAAEVRFALYAQDGERVNLYPVTATLEGPGWEASCAPQGARCNYRLNPGSYAVTALWQGRTYRTQVRYVPLNETERRQERCRKLRDKGVQCE